MLLWTFCLLKVTTAQYLQAARKPYEYSDITLIKIAGDFNHDK